MSTKKRSRETTAFTATHIYQKISINTTNRIRQVVILPVFAGGEVGEICNMTYVSSVSCCIGNSLLSLVQSLYEKKYIY